MYSKHETEKLIVDIFKCKTTEHVRHAQRVVLLITDRENEYLSILYYLPHKYVNRCKAHDIERMTHTHSYNQTARTALAYWWALQIQRYYVIHSFLHIHISWTLE